MADLDPTRQRILDAAGPLFASRGFDSVSVREITTDAGTNVAAVNYHFRSKEHLYVEAVRHAAELCESTTPTPHELERPAEVRLRLFVEAFLTRLLRDDVPDWHRQLIMRELAQPRCGATEVFVENFVRPSFLALTGILRDLVPARVSDDEIHLLGMSVVAQCLHQHHARHVIPLLLDERAHRLYTIDRLTDHICAFSLAAIRGLYPEAKGGRR